VQCAAQEQGMSVSNLATRTLPRASSLVGSRFCCGSQMQNSEFLFASGDQGEFTVLWTRQECTLLAKLD
jgi:hypothetical protein